MPRKSSKYVISLDEMDIGLLPTSYIPNCVKTASLWTKHIRNDDYYEFEIKSTCSDNKDDLNDNIIEYTICHICDIDVPKAFTTQHINSNKHKINIKIADIAMERIKKSYQNNIANDNNLHSSEHFCTSCVVVVNKNERAAHDKSLMHKNSVIVDKFLHDFYLLYKNSDNDINEIEIDGNSEMKNNDIAKNEGNINLDASYSADDSREPEKENLKCLDEIKNEINDSILNVESPEKDLQDSDISPLNKTIESENNSTEPIKNVRVKAKRRKPKNKNKNQEKSDQNSITNNEPITKNGECESGIEKNNNFFPNFEDNVEKPFKDVDLYEENAHFVSHIQTTMYSSYCKVCLGSLSDGFNSHLNSYDHIVRYYDLLSKQSLVSEGSKTFCEACGVTVEKENELEHCEDLKHIIKHEIYKKRVENQ